MILITLGSQKFQFNRLLEEIDKLIESEKIKEEVFAQIGYSDYTPQNYEYTKFLTREEMTIKIQQSDTVITHGGTGAIITALKNGKKVIAVPRMKQYGEHVDDHQLQIVKQFEGKLISAVYDIKDLGKELENIQTKEFKTYESNTNQIIQSIENYIKNIQTEIGRD